MSNDNKTSPTILAVIIHEAGRAPVAAGETMAHASGSGKPFVEFSALPVDARKGLLLTAERLLEQVTLGSIDDKATSLAPGALAKILHEAQQPAIERGWVRQPTGQPFTEWSDLPQKARDGGVNRARWILDRFSVVQVGVKAEG